MGPGEYTPDSPEGITCVEDLPAHRADAAADLEHVRPEMRAHQAENVTLVPDRLAHRLEVVGRVLLLCLGESVVDVHA